MWGVSEEKDTWGGMENEILFGGRVVRRVEAILNRWKSRVMVLWLNCRFWGSCNFGTVQLFDWI